LVHQQKVTTGDLTGTAGIQILDGLQSGETIAVSGASQLREGMKVRPFNP
jgi:multidrug efflux pump subunit AcrA (membrane-fusion protein)